MKTFPAWPVPQKTSNAELWCCLWYQLEQAIKNNRDAGDLRGRDARATSLSLFGNGWIFLSYISLGMHVINHSCWDLSFSMKCDRTQNITKPQGKQTYLDVYANRFAAQSERRQMLNIRRKCSFHKICRKSMFNRVLLWFGKGQYYPYPLGIILKNPHHVCAFSVRHQAFI